MTAARWRLDAKNAVVTGGTRGIGLAITTELLQLGATVLVVGRDPARLERRLTDWQQRGHSVHTVAADVSEPAGVQKIVAAVEAKFG
ncbi:MAG: SDR family NAD(P)-dependent oxidoreductase, partial [Gammaproteobacteria bacterium]|nr:SDR family NAD(P)-dependent oxidoreductase [Gammaproteobacteria bacterium]